MREYKLDAKNQILGRFASKIAVLLQGKDSAKYLPRLVGDVKVFVENASKIKVTGNKMAQKLYRHYTGYPGGLRTRTLRQVSEKNPKEVLQKAVWNMLPKNRLRSKRMRNLIIHD